MSSHAFFSSSASATTGLDELPSVFQLVACDGLRNSMKPAFKYAMRFLATRYPEHLSLAHRFSDELFLTLDLLLQRHYLHTYNALFSENFYGLERTKMSLSMGSVRQSDVNVFVTLLSCSVVPYLKGKLDGMFERWREEDADGIGAPQGAASKVLAKSRTYFLRIYPYLHMLHSLTHLIYLVKYSLGSSTYHSPLNRLALNRVINLSPDRAKEMEARSGSGLAAAFTGGLSMGLEVGAFFLQFLDWWYSSESKTRNVTSLPIPPPPPVDPHAESLRGLCPICRGPRRNETLLQPSGYVFCYSCIVSHLRGAEGNRCPVTKYPAKEDQLIRIYGNN